MAKIVRKNQKLFGSLAGANEIAKFGSLAAASPVRYSGSTADPDNIQALSNFLDGWFGATMGDNSPAEEDENALFFLAFYQLFYLLQTGIPEWNTDTIYFVGSMVNDGVNNIYVSLTDNNTGNALTSNTNWQLYGSNFSTKTSGYTAAINDEFIRGNTTSGGFTITLPAVATSKGMKVTIKNTGTIAAGNNLTVDGNASEKIDEALTVVLTPLDTITIFCNGTNWDVI